MCFTNQNPQKIYPNQLSNIVKNNVALLLCSLVDRTSIRDIKECNIQLDTDTMLFSTHIGALSGFSDLNVYPRWYS